MDFTNCLVSARLLAVKEVSEGFLYKIELVEG